MLLISIALSIFIATSVHLQADELGALLNIYMPFFIGLFTILILSVVFLFNKKVFLRIAVLIFCVFANLLAGLYLKINFHAFLNDAPVSKAEKPPDRSVFKFSSYSIPVKNPGNVIIENMDGFPSNNHLVFSLIHLPWKKPEINSAYNFNHDKVTIRIKNQKKYSVKINKASFSRGGLWEICRINSLAADGSAFPITILPGGYADVTVAFTAAIIDKRIKPSFWKAMLKFQNYMLTTGRTMDYQFPVGTTCLNINGKLCLETDDDTEPVKTISLSSIWQYHGESDWEPDMQRVLNALNFKTKVGFKNFDNALNGEKISPLSDEIPVAYFETADKNRPVKIIKLASYHGCCLVGDADTLKYYYPAHHILKPLLYSDFRSGQMLLPPSLNTANNYATFTPPAPFTFKISSAYLDRRKNYHKKIGIRVWKAIDDQGNLITNSYILGNDYLGKKGTNYDYQDNVYYVENVKPFLKLPAP